MTSFDDLGISAKLIGAMNDMGWTEPTPIQCEAVPVGIAGNDLIAKAQTGTGKTGAYAMIVMSRIGKGAKVPSALVVTPTRELAMQVDTELRKLSKLSGHVSTAVYGGAPIERQITALRRGADIIVGTPGRLKDMIERDALDLSQIREVVLDEADRMLDMGFEEDLDFIMSYVPDPHQTLLFSATLGRDVMRLANEMLDNPAEVDISGDTPTTGLTKQYIISCKRNEKKDVLYEILSKGTPKTIVFFATKLMVDTVYQELKDMGFRVGTLHGDMAQKLRERVIGDFRDNRLLTLLATDVAARGLDVTDVDLVINFDLPIDPETYLHRIGRTGRAGKEGISVSLVNPRDRKLVRMCEEEADTEMEKIDPEDLEPIDAVHEPVAKERAKKEKKMKVEKHRNNDFRNRETAEREGFATIEISIGKADGVNRTAISDFLKQRAGVEDEAIGKVGLKDDRSFVEVSLDHYDFILENLDGCEFEGKTVSIKPAPKKEKAYSDSPRADPEGFDRRRENRYKNYQKRMEREAEESEEEIETEEDSELETFDDDTRAVRQYGDRPRHSSPRDYGDRGRNYRRPRERGFGDRPGNSDRRTRGFGDRDYVRRDFDGEERPRYSDRGERPRYSDRKDYGDRPYRPREGGYRPHDDRPRGNYSEGRRSDRSYGGRSSGRGDRPYGGRSSGYGDRPYRPREGGYRERSSDREDRPYRERSYGDRPRRDYGDRPRRDREERPYRPREERPRDETPKPKRYPSNRDAPKAKRRSRY